jgi:RHS repeat-associated protein
MHFTYDQVGHLTYYERGLDAVKNNLWPNAGYYFGGFTQAYDGAGNLKQVTGNTTGPNIATNIFANPDYFPTGQTYTALLLGLYIDKYSVTPRQWYTGELVTNAAGTTMWQSSASHNNTGTVAITTDKAAGDWTYTYDPMNRMSTAHGPVGNVSYSIDPFGNKFQQTVTWGTAPTQSSVVATSNALTGNGLTYDLLDASGTPKGNVTFDGFHHYTYDAEGRLYQVDSSTCYTYDGDGDRVARTNCNVTGAGSATQGVLAEFLYDPDHRLMSEVNVATGQITRANVYAGDKLVAEDAPDSFVTTPTATQLRVTDQVGTLRGLLDLGQHVNESCTSFPFGDGVTCSSAEDKEFFTGKQRDTESDLDYFGTRYYNSTVGRFMSPDPSGLAYANPSNPQSLNLYAYVLNNPLTNIDPTGLDCTGTEATANQTSGLSAWDANSADQQAGPPSCATPVPTIVHQDGTVSYQETVEVSGSAPSSDLALLQAGSNVGPSGSQVPANTGNAPNNGPTVSHCLGVVAADKGLSIALDAVGSVPIFGNEVAAGGRLVRAAINVDHVITKPAVAFGSGAYGAYGAITTGPEEATDSLVGAGSAGAGIGLVLADASLAGTTAIPIVGNFVSVATLGWDGYQAYKKYQSCMAGH